VIRQLIGHTATYTFANIVSRGTILVWLVVLPTFLSTAEYGVLGLIMTTAAMVNVLVPLEVTQGYARYYPTAPEQEKRGYAVTAWTFTLLTLSLAASIAWIFSPSLNRLLFGDGRYLTAFRTGIGFFELNTIFYFIQNQFRWDFRARDYTIVTLVFALVTLAASIGLAVSLPNSLVGVLVGLVLGAGTGLALGLSRLSSTLGIGIDAAKLNRMLRFSLAIVPGSVAILLSTYASRFILNDLLSLTDVGLFTWASQLATIPALLLLGVQSALTPLVMKHHPHPQTKAVIARSFEAVVAVELLFCLGLGMFTPEFIRLLGYSRYAGAGPLVMLLAPAYLMLQLYVFAPGFAIGERTELQLFVSVVGAISAIALNFVFVGAWGLTGAAVAMLASSATFIGSWFFFSNRIYPVPIRWLKVGALVGVVIACALVASMTAGMSPRLAIAAKAVLLSAFAAAACALGFVHRGQLRLLLESRRAGGAVT